MALRRAFGRRLGFHRRKMLNGHWTGGQNGGTLDDATLDVFNLWDTTSSENVNASGILTPKRIVFNFSLQAAGAASETSQVCWYITKFQTDLAEAAVSALIWDPASTDTDLAEKRLLHQGTLKLTQPASIANGAPYSVLNHTIDLKPRGFKFDSQQEQLVAVFTVAPSGGDVTYYAQFRTYCTWK